MTLYVQINTDNKIPIFLWFCNLERDKFTFAHQSQCKTCYGLYTTVVCVNNEHEATGVLLFHSTKIHILQ